MWSPDKFYIALLESFSVLRVKCTSRKAAGENSNEINHCHSFEKNQTNMHRILFLLSRWRRGKLLLYSRRRRPDCIKDFGAGPISIKLLIKRMCGHLVRLENKNINISWTGLFVPKTRQNCCQKLKENPINMRFYMLFVYKVSIQEQNSAYLIIKNSCRTVQLHAYFEDLKIWKNERVVH